MIPHGRTTSGAAGKLLKLCALRAGFALGGRIAPRQTVERAARLFATPHASSRSRARAVRADGEMRRCEIATDGHTIATYVWGEPTREPYGPAVAAALAEDSDAIIAALTSCGPCSRCPLGIRIADRL